MIKNLLIFFINIYQKTISLDHGILSYLIPFRYCRHIPTCSEYTKLAILKYGSLKGLKMGLKRILKCHPWGSYGIDYP